MNIQDIHNLFLQCKTVSIDTRKIEKDSMFFAIKGENFDANTFAAQALELGALFVVIDNASYFIDERTILVDNSLETLQELAKFHRTYNIEGLIKKYRIASVENTPAVVVPPQTPTPPAPPRI